MDYSWNGLADRCQLFLDAERPLLIELLKEAQSELSNECLLYDSVFTYIGGDLGYREGDGRNTNYGVLPSDYLQDVGVWCNSTPLKKMSEKDFYYKDSGSTNYRRNVPDDGEPSFYYISGGHIQFDSNPNDTDEIMLYYKSRLSTSNASKMTYAKILSTNRLSLPFDLKEELNNLSVYGQGSSQQFVAYNLQYNGQYQENIIPKSLDPFHYNTDQLNNPDGITNMCNQYNATIGGDTSGLKMVQIAGFGGIAPVIPSEYHLSLCDYAIAIASAKKNPEMHDRHLSIWTARMQNIKNKDADKDLMFNIREVV
jgi:hypothetical protein